MKMEPGRAEGSTGHRKPKRRLNQPQRTLRDVVRGVVVATGRCSLARHDSVGLWLCGTHRGLHVCSTKTWVHQCCHTEERRILINNHSLYFWRSHIEFII
ncbi:hypothetical protein NDU88_001302 [Pleurodeles waltl]|uniref:Uncharacterized protein n=1 Tax=Pleurodeles waltl TaxID=8319 RepID=A0AAV7P6S2_PLEWA|nr:hypothetical protein NDU88_001302 [Pleurodeles waltl]